MIYFIRKENMPCSENEICVSCELTFTIKYAILNIYIGEVMQDKWQVRQKVYYGEVCD